MIMMDHIGGMPPFRDLGVAEARKKAMAPDDRMAGTPAC
jgi:hypothetical protein